MGDNQSITARRGWDHSITVRGRRYRVTVWHNQGHPDEHPAEKCPGGGEWPCNRNIDKGETE